MSSRGRVQVSPREDAAGGRAGTGVAVGSGVGVAVAVAVGSAVGVSVGEGVDVWVGLAVGGAGVLVGRRSVAVGDTDTLSPTVPPQLTTRIRMISTAAIALHGTDMFCFLSDDGQAEASALRVPQSCGARGADQDRRSLSRPDPTPLQYTPKIDRAHRASGLSTVGQVAYFSLI